MMPDAQLVDLFRGVRQDARADPKPTEIAHSFPIDIGFDGAGALPTVGQVQVVPLGNLKARITGAVIVANGVGTATIDLRLGTLADVPTLGQIYNGGTIPTLTASATAVLDISAWTRHLQPADVLIATLMSVSSVIAPPTFGALTCVSLSLYCIRLKWPAGGSSLTDTGGDTLLTTGGATVTLRS